MLTERTLSVVAVAGLSFATAAVAGDRGFDTLIGATVGTAIGCGVGGRNGAVVGGVLGAAVDAGSGRNYGDRATYYNNQAPAYYQPAEVAPGIRLAG